MGLYNRTHLRKNGLLCLAIHNPRLRPDLSARLPPGGSLAVVGWIGLWRRSLLPCLPLS